VVDFNSLDINFNLQTWVVILDFFGIGSGETLTSVVDPDSDFVFDADPDPTFHSDADADPDPDPSFKKRFKPLEKVRIRIWFRIQLINFDADQDLF
jgi:hypothetical protein